MASPQTPHPRNGGVKSLYSRIFPLLSWEKGVRGMRPKFTRKKRKSHKVDPTRS